MKLTFLGTRGEIEAKSNRHRRHTSLLIEYRKKRIMIDCGRDWQRMLKKIDPDHIVLTHAHPDHAWGLKKGAPCNVWAPRATWKLINDYPIKKRKSIPLRKSTKIAGVTFQAFPLLHSIRCPAVGYRISIGKKAVFYAPDVLWIKGRQAALRGIWFYIGDGATIQNNFVRRAKSTGELIGHANIRVQLTWCKKEKVHAMIVTHCGSEIVKNEKRAIQRIEELAEQRGVTVEVAYDGLTIEI